VYIDDNFVNCIGYFIKQLPLNEFKY